MWGFGEAYPIYILLYPGVGSVMRSDDLVLCEIDFLAQTPTAGHNVYGAAEVGLKSIAFHYVYLSLVSTIGIRTDKNL
jgi:hypothetical protein